MNRIRRLRLLALATAAVLPALLSAPSGSAAGGKTCFGEPATLVDGSYSSYIVGTPGKDVVFLGGGDDSYQGRGGPDLICGGAGNDVLNGEKGADKIAGGKGNDTLIGGDGQDVLNGGPGTDKCFVDATTTASGCET